MKNAEKCYMDARSYENFAKIWRISGPAAGQLPAARERRGVRGAGDHAAALLLEEGEPAYAGCNFCLGPAFHRSFGRLVHISIDASDNES